MKKLLKILLLCVVIYGMSPELSVSAARIEDSGTCGDLSWTLDSNGLLYISGSGDYVYTDTDGKEITMPIWRNYEYEVKSVKVDVTNITNCSCMFWGLYEVKTIDLSGLDTQYVTDMSSMFLGCESLTSIEFGSIDTSNVTDMSGMFEECLSLEEIKVDQFDTSKVTNISNMFAHCTSLKEISLANFDISNVTNMAYMFCECSSLKTISLKGLNALKATDMSCMFRACDTLQTIILDNMNMSNVTDMSYMFSLCPNLQTISLTGVNTESVTNMNGMFSGSGMEILDLSMLDTSNVTGMQEMFYECRKLKSVDLSGFNTSKVTDMIRMFMYCTSLESLDLSSFKTNSLEDMIEMFCMCQSLDVLDLSGFDLSNTQAEWTFGNFIYEHEGMVLKTPVNYKGTTKFFYNSDSFGNEGEFFLWTDGDGKIYDSLPNLPHSVTLTLKSYPADYFYEDISPKKKNTVMTISSKKCKVKVTSSSMNNPTVTYMKSTNSNATSITIPDKVTVDEITYKVTAVSSKAFKNNKKLKSVTIGKNVKTIGKEAFYNCKKLKKITIKSSALKSVEKNAIKNIEKKATIKVPKSKLKKYKSLFKSKTGYKKTMKIKK